MQVTVAATQMKGSRDRAATLARADALVREAAARGAQIVLLQEMWETRFFAFNDWKPEHFALAAPADNHPALAHMAALAADLGVVLPVNFYERANNAYYNTVMVIDADGQMLGLYRKSHIPLGPPGCYEKVYTNPGDTGFCVWPTRFGTIGVGICWDQWFPEAARIMVLKGADILFYPTAIGSDCHDHWEVVIRGHAGANLVPVVVSNRVGTERGDLGETTYWGRSFIAGPQGEIVAKAGSEEEGVIIATFDLEANRMLRANWGVFRDRRPDLYAPLLSFQG